MLRWLVAAAVVAVAWGVEAVEEVTTSVAWVEEVATSAAAVGMEATSLGVVAVATTRVEVGAAGMSAAWAAVATMPVGVGMAAAGMWAAWAAVNMPGMATTVDGTVITSTSHIDTTTASTTASLGLGSDSGGGPATIGTDMAMVGAIG
jgi:hypothetical protein